LRRLTTLVTLLSCVGEARAQFGLSGSSSSGAIEALILVMLCSYGGLLLWGWFIGLDAFIPPPTLSTPRRAASRWIGLNALEPSITTLLSVGIVFSSTNPAFSGAWFALPLVTFFALLLLPLFMRSRSDVAIRQVQRRLRQIFLARAVPLVLAVLSLALDQTWLAISALFIGLVGLGWCWLMLTREVGKLHMQPVVTEERSTAHVA
jgi:hypothetical protein